MAVLLSKTCEITEMTLAISHNKGTHTLHISCEFEMEQATFVRLQFLYRRDQIKICYLSDYSASCIALLVSDAVLLLRTLATHSLCSHNHISVSLTALSELCVGWNCGWYTIANAAFKRKVSTFLLNKFRIHSSMFVAILLLT